MLSKKIRFILGLVILTGVIFPALNWAGIERVEVGVFGMS
jgi:hypothetical protein